MENEIERKNEMKKKLLMEKSANFKASQKTKCGIPKVSENYFIWFYVIKEISKVTKNVEGKEPLTLSYTF